MFKQIGSKKVTQADLKQHYRSTMLDLRAKELVKEKGISYRDAVVQVSRQDAVEFSEENNAGLLRFNVMNPEEKIDPESLTLDQKAKRLSEEKKIPYKQALVQVYTDQERGVSKFREGDENLATAEAVEKYYNKAKNRIGNFSKDVKERALADEVSLGLAIVKVAEELANLVDYELPDIEAEKAAKIENE